MSSQYSNTLDERAAAELHVELIPGTEIMREIESIHFPHASGSNVILLPHPSTSMSDPLNWSMRWKLMAISSQTLFTWIAVMSALSIAPMFPLLGAEFHIDETQLGLLTGVCVLALGYANFIIVPCSNIFGRRFASIIFSGLAIATTIWEAEARTHGGLLGARVLNGFATATSESLMVQVVADLFFVHERGLWMGIYFTSYFLGLFIGPIIAGNIAERHGWRSFFWLATGLSGLAFLLILFMFPETKFHRDNPVGEGSTGRPVSDTASPAVDKIALSEIELRGMDQAHLHRVLTVNVGKGRPVKLQLKLLQRPDRRWQQFLIRDIVSPFRVFLFPIILWAGLMVAGPANLLLLWNLTESSLLSASPYNWNSSQVGYANFSFVVGGLIGLFTAGPFSDWVARRSTQSNNGIREAEMRLPALLPYTIFTIIGIVVGGVGYQRLWPWEVILVIGYGFTGLCVTTVPTIAVAYAIDCYKPISGEIMVVATILKNTCGFAMSYWVPSLSEEKGFIVPAMAMFALVVGPVMLTIPLYYYGKSLRRLTKKSPMHRMEQDA